MSLAVPRLCRDTGLLNQHFSYCAPRSFDERASGTAGAVWSRPALTDRADDLVRLPFDLVVLLELWRRGTGVKTGAKLLEA
jgi:hypothetical protein